MCYTTDHGIENLAELGDNMNAKRLHELPDMHSHCTRYIVYFESLFVRIHRWVDIFSYNGVVYLPSNHYSYIHTFCTGGKSRWH